MNINDWGIEGWTFVIGFAIVGAFIGIKTDKAFGDKYPPMRWLITCMGIPALAVLLEWVTKQFGYLT